MKMACSDSNQKDVISSCGLEIQVCLRGWTVSPGRHFSRAIIKAETMEEH